ncbi:hypothetical protein ABZ943_38860, partial [Streptomyces rubiginosohelvolus]|uniref:hypothetical protein n=1 Tax=Streptomyces rubiginosohelvolus TaxID=67362 RepID=UPI0033F587AA
TEALDRRAEPGVHDFVILVRTPETRKARPETDDDMRLPPLPCGPSQSRARKEKTNSRVIVQGW